MENSLSKYTIFTKALLQKFNDTSYLNAILQCLGNIDNLVKFFLNPKEISIINGNISEYRLSFVIGRLYDHFYPLPEKEKITYGNEKILGVLCDYNHTYKSVEKRNPCDTIGFLLSTLHNELNKKNNNNIENNFDKDDKQSTIKFGIINFVNKNDSIISNTFSYFIIKEFYCEECTKTIYNFQNFNTLDLDILETSKQKGNNKSINIKDCLDYFCEKKTKKRFCEKCKKNVNVDITSKIYSSPNYFIFLLDRGNLDENLNIKFDIEEKIDLKKYIEKENTPYLYELVGIVTINIIEKKYESFSKSPIDQMWYLYDEKDAQLRKDIVFSNNNEMIFYIPCILFYKKIIKND